MERVSAERRDLVQRHTHTFRTVLGGIKYEGKVLRLRRDGRQNRGEDGWP